MSPSQRSPKDVHKVVMQPQAFGFGRLFESIRDAVIVADATGRVVLWNPAAVAMFGYTPLEATQLNIDVIVPERYHARHHLGMERYHDTGHGPLIDTHTPVELPAVRKDGEEIVVELRLSALEENGERYAMAVLRDVTDRARLHAELVKRAAELEASNAAYRDANEALKAFTYVVGHDLKEPVRAVEAFLRATLEDYGSELPREAAELVQRAQGANARLHTLLSGLLEFGRVSRMELRPEPLDVYDVITGDSCRAAYERLLQERGAVLDAKRDIPLVSATEPVLCQVLSNFITNAIKHNSCAVPRVRLSGRRTLEGPVEILVEDNGVGFPPEMMERLSAGLPSTINPSGSGGFGLIIARRAVERLGGRLWIDRSPDLGGGLVGFTLPPAT